MLTNKDSAFLLGLTAGEGSFIIRGRIRDDRSFGIEVRPEFQVQMHEREEEAIEYFVSETNLGTLSERGSRPYVQWRIGRQDECMEFAELVEKHSEGTPFSKTEKYVSFQKWKKAVSMVHRGEHLTRDGLEAVLRLKDDMNYHARGHRNSLDDLLAEVEKNSDTLEDT